MASVFDSYAPYKGDLARRNTGSLVAFETGESITYGLFNAQERGDVYKRQILWWLRVPKTNILWETACLSIQN